MLTGCATMMIGGERQSKLKEVKEMRDEYLAANPDLSPALKDALLKMKIEYWETDAERRLKYIIENEELPEEVKIRILKGNVKVGMPEEQCIASVGEKRWEEVKRLLDMITSSLSDRKLSLDIKDFLKNMEIEWFEDISVSRRLEYVMNHRSLPTKEAIKILQGYIWIGMTKEQAEASWGYIKVLNRSVGSWGVHEQCECGKFYLYFEDGILTSWQEEVR